MLKVQKKYSFFLLFVVFFFLFSFTKVQAIEYTTDNSSMHDLDALSNYDYVLNRYIDDYEFRKELKKEIVHVKIKKSCTDILKAIVESIIHIFDKYVESTTRKITIARWI